MTWAGMDESVWQNARSRRWRDGDNDWWLSLLPPHSRLLIFASHLAAV
jgi:hypothetical protein